MPRKKLVGAVTTLVLHRDELVADFQQYYGLSIPLDGEPRDLPRIAALWSQLPAGSRTFRREAPELEWSTTDYLLWRLEYDVRSLMWGLSDPKKRGNEPRPMETPAKRAEAIRKRDSALSHKDEIARVLGIEV